jgi:hypothetical protein
MDFYQSISLSKFWIHSLSALSCPYAQPNAAENWMLHIVAQLPERNEKQRYVACRNIQLTFWNKIHVVKVIVVPIIKTFLAFYGSRRFIIMFKIVSH